MKAKQTAAVLALSVVVLTLVGCDAQAPSQPVAKTGPVAPSPVKMAPAPPISKGPSTPVVVVTPGLFITTPPTPVTKKPDPPKNPPPQDMITTPAPSKPACCTTPVPDKKTGTGTYKADTGTNIQGKQQLSQAPQANQQPSQQQPPPQGSSSASQQFPKVTRDQLPPEAKDTLDLIAKGGPFPYPDRDGTTWENRKNPLPPHPEDPNYYKEYTVPTPGETNRGTKRIVKGKNGETYYTENHYKTFEEVKNGN